MVKEIKNNLINNFIYYLPIVTKNLLNIIVIKMLSEYKGNTIITGSIYLIFYIFIVLVEVFL